MAIKWLTTSQAVFMQSEGTYVLLGTSDTFRFMQGGNNTVWAAGTNQTLVLNESDTVVDVGRGLNLEPLWTSWSVSVYDFQFDPRAHVTLMYGDTGSLSPDGHGGTLLTITGFGPQEKIDFVGDQHLTAAQIHSAPS
jgi:hypothetical protein